MSELDKLLQGYAPPPITAGLAERVAAEAARHAQEPGIAAPRRHDRRGGWKRPLWIGATGFGLAFTSAVAATVVSGGRIEIPVVQQVVEAIPVLEKAKKRYEPAVEVAEAKPVSASPAAEQPPASQPGEPGYRRAQVMRKLEAAKSHVEARRAAGLPTPRADRIEARAKAIVARREAAGLPTPTLEEVEAGLALRELRRMWWQRRAGGWNASMLTDAQLARIAGRLPPERRERFLALSPDTQRQLVGRQLEKLRLRRAMRQAPVDPQSGQAPPAEPAEPEIPPADEGAEGNFSDPR